MSCESMHCESAGVWAVRACQEGNECAVKAYQESSNVQAGYCNLLL